MIKDKNSFENQIRNSEDKNEEINLNQKDNQVESNSENLDKNNENQTDNTKIDQKSKKLQLFGEKLEVNEEDSSKNKLSNEIKETNILNTKNESTEFEIKNDNDFTVSDPIKKDGFNSYILYTIKSKSLKTPLLRRYNDFYVLRSKLIERWPGLYIPNIPPKKGNLDSKFINYRMKLLNKFCIQICKQDYLLNSPEFTTFLSNSPDIEKALNKLGEQNYEQLYYKYKKVFPNIHETYNFEVTILKINEIKLFLGKILENLKSFKDKVNFFMQKKTDEIETYVSLISHISDYENNFINQITNQDKSKLIFLNDKNTELSSQLLKLKDSIQNPYTKLHDWLCEEELDVEAVIESIDSLNTLSESKIKLIHKKTTLQKNIEDLLIGNKSIKNMFSFKSNKNEVAELENQKTTTQIHIDFLESIIKIATIKMEYNLRIIKAEKLNGYYETMKLFSEIQKSNGSNTIDFWNQVSNDKNIQSINKNIRLSIARMDSCDIIKADI